MSDDTSICEAPVSDDTTDTAPCDEPDFVEMLLDCRRELAAKGVVIDYDAAMEEIDGPRATAM